MSGMQLVLLSETPVICILLFFERFLFVPSGPFLLGCNARLRRFRAFLLSSRGWGFAGRAGVRGGEGGGSRLVPSPPGGPSLARAFTLARCAAAPQVTKFRELRDFYGCPPKVDLEVGISASSRSTLVLPGIL